MTISVLTLPLTPLVLVVGFVLFRIFDVVKPFPAGASQRLGGGVGVMIDDADRRALRAGPAARRPAAGMALTPGVRLVVLGAPTAPIDDDAAAVVAALARRRRLAGEPHGGGRGRGRRWSVR